MKGTALALAGATLGAALAVVFLVRLSPVFPFNVVSYALGLTRVRFRQYVGASAVGMIPGTFLYVCADHTAGQVAGPAVAGAPRGAGYRALLTAGLIATVVATVVVTRTARRALERNTNLEGEVL